MRLSAWLLGLLLLAWAHPAHAYPEFQFSTGATRCAECHYAPVGGGLLNAYGRDEAATIADAGDGRFLHGLVELPAWFQLGGDVRLAALGKRAREGVEGAVFPMQLDLYARVASERWSVNATFGVLEAIRQPAPITDRLGSREHFVMYQADAWYVRTGRFFPTFGLRLPDHTAYVRRYTGLHSLEENYGAGAGFVTGSWEAHATLLTPLDLFPRVGRHGWGGALYVERTNAASTGSAALQAKVLRTDGGYDGWLGATWKRWIESPALWLAAEVDVGALTVEDAPVIARIVGYGAVHYRPAKRWGLAVGAQVYDADLRLVDNDRIGLELRAALFARAHLELAALVRGTVVGREVSRGDVLGFLQLHYFL